MAGRRLLGPADCTVGAKIDVLARTYEILSGDPATHEFMERYPAVFPASDGMRLLQTLRPRCA